MRSISWEALLVYDIPPVIAAAGAITAALLDRRNHKEIRNRIAPRVEEVHEKVENIEQSVNGK